MNLSFTFAALSGCEPGSTTDNAAEIETGLSETGGSETGVSDSDPTETGETGETAPYTSTENIGDQPTVESDWIFDQTLIHHVEIEIDDNSWYNLLNAPYEYTGASVHIDGVPAPDVGVRLRGKIGSFRPITGKPKFKIDFNHYQSDRRYFGLKSLSLNNSVVDCSYEKELIGYEVLRQVGLAAPRIAYANVSVNAVDYGLYLILESEDKPFIERQYPDASGNLYDGKYDYDPATGGYTLIDFVDAVDDLFQLEEGTDVAHADIFAITAAAAANYGGPDYSAGLDPLLDWDVFHRTIAAEQWLGHNDGYALNTNNYRVYFDPSDGKADLISWDFDYTFLEDAWWGLNWAAPRGTLAAGCWYDAACREAQRQAAANVSGAIDVAELFAKLEAWNAISSERVLADPRRECTVENVAVYRQFVRDWLTIRPGYMQNFWGF